MAESGQAPAAGQLPAAAAGGSACAAEAWMQQALAARAGSAAPAFLPPAHLAAYYAANAAQFAQAYNAQLMAAGLPNPYAFMPGAVQQAQVQAMARAGSHGGLPPVAPNSAELRASEDGGARKRQWRDRSSSDMRADAAADGSRFSGSQSPASEPGSEAPGGGGEGSEAAGLGASASVHSLAGAGGLQDEREVKKLRRKQSNRESARRSRLRKQAECEALSGRVGELLADNARLREINRQLLLRVEELVAKLERQHTAPGKVGLASEGGAFHPVAPAQPPAAPATASNTAAGSTEPTATAVKQEPGAVPEKGTSDTAAGPASGAAAAGAEDAGCGVCTGDSCPAG